MNIIEKIDEPHTGFVVEGENVVKTSINFLKSLGKIGGSILFFFVLALVFFALKKPTYALFCIFYIPTILVRIPDTYSDAVALESVATLSMLLLLIDGPILAAVFAISSLWLTKYISPFGPVEEYSETFGMSISITAAIFISPLFPHYATKDLLMFMIYFQLARFLVYMILITFMAPGIFLTEVVYTLVSIPMTLIQSYLILTLIGVWILNSYGIHGWHLFAFQSLFIK